MKSGPKGCTGAPGTPGHPGPSPTLKGWRPGHSPEPSWWKDCKGCQCCGGFTDPGRPKECREKPRRDLIEPGHPGGNPCKEWPTPPAAKGHPSGDPGPKGERGPFGYHPGMVSVIIPTHDPKYLRETLESVAQQTAQNFEVIVAPNGKKACEVGTFEKLCREAFKERPDIGWRVVPLKSTGIVGAVKHEAFSLASGEWLVELDHDDLLRPVCLERILSTADKNPDATMIYSDDHYFGKWAPWNSIFGWQYREEEGKRINIAPDPVPQNLCRIWYGPDHVRAWRQDWYLLNGGHNPALSVADDHDLVCRSWLYGKIVHIPEGLYEYRVHDKQTSKEHFAKIQQTQWAVYMKYIEDFGLEWSRREGLLSLDLGGGLHPRKRFLAVDKEKAPIVADLRERWPFSDNSVGCLRAADLLEHLPDPIHTMNEAWRVLKHGGFFFIRVPSTDGRGAFRDPTHKSFWNIESFWYYTQKMYRNFIPQFKGRFQTLRAVDTKVGRDVSTEVHLIAIKDGMRFHGKEE